MTHLSLSRLCPFAFLALCLGIFQPLRAEEPTGTFREVKGLAFTDADPSLRLDMFLPENAAEPTACVIVIQGGGFLAQNGQRFRPFAVYLAERGIAAALIAYRGRPDHDYRVTMADAKAAVRFVREAGEQYNIDPTRLGATGRSAGGTITALLAVTGGDASWDGDDGHDGVSSAIQAGVAFAGVFDFVSRFTDPEQIAMQPKVKTKIETNGEWIAAPFATDDEDWLRASAVTHVDRNDPPLLLMQCKDDATVPWLQTRDLHRAMQAAGVRSEVKYYDTGGHGFKGLDEKPMAEMVRFFQATLGDGR